MTSSALSFYSASRSVLRLVALLCAQIGYWTEQDEKGLRELSRSCGKYGAEINEKVQKFDAIHSITIARSASKSVAERPVDKSALGTAQSNPDYHRKCDEILKLDAKITDQVLLAKQKLVNENRKSRNQINAKKCYAQTATMNKSL